MGNGFVHTSSPFSPTTGLPASSSTSTASPSERHCSSPRNTGSTALASANAAMMSVPPEMEDRHTSGLMSRYT
jgi:hypothetical protein